MATPYRTEYITLGTLMSGSLAIDCHDWSDLLGVPDKKGGDAPLPGVTGIGGLDRVGGPHRGQLLYRLNSRYDQDNVVQARSTWRTNLYTLLAAVRAAVEVNTTQTLTLTAPGGPYEADCIVTSGFRPVHRSPEIVTFGIEVLLPGGGLL